MLLRRRAPGYGPRCLDRCITAPATRSHLPRASNVRNCKHDTNFASGVCANGDEMCPRGDLSTPVSSS
jgi:hypothetical protein